MSQFAPGSQLAPGSPFGPYVVEGFVAGGGMGKVYAATHGVYGTPVALKVLHERFAADERWQKRFSDEGLLGLALKHPHVLAARELVHQGTDVALVLDLVRGGQTLGSVVEREHPGGLGAGASLGVFLRVVSGVEYLHERGVIHGDLKPENVLVEGPVREPGQWVPRVTDFGTVALIADPVLIDGRPAVVASPRYASPEHVRGVDHIDARSDTYALGLLLHWLLSGRHASGARTVSEALDFVHHPIPLVALVDQPDPILALVERATDPNPERRFPDCRALALAARDVLDTLGLSLTLEDLQADLATELIEGRHRGAASPDPGTPEGTDSADSEIDPGPPLPGDDPGLTTAEPVVTLAPPGPPPPAVDVAVPEVAVPEVAVPEVAVPEVAVPEVAAVRPESPEPSLSVPEPSAPEPSAPEPSAAEPSAPEPSAAGAPPIRSPLGTPPAAPLLRPNISLLLTPPPPMEDPADRLVVGTSPAGDPESDEDLPTVSAGARVVLRPTYPAPAPPAQGGGPAPLEYALPGIEDPDDATTDVPDVPVVPPASPPPKVAVPPDIQRTKPAPASPASKADPKPEPYRRVEPVGSPEEPAEPDTRTRILRFLALALAGSVLGLLTAWAVWAAGLLGG